MEQQLQYEKNFMKNLLINQRKYYDLLLEHIERENTDNLLSPVDFYPLIPNQLDIMSQQIENLRHEVNGLKNNIVPCRYASSSENNEIHMVLGPSSNTATRAKGFDELSNFTKGASELIVVDNYFLEDSDKFSQSFIKCLDKDSLKTLYILYSNGQKKKDRKQPSIISDIYHHIGTQVNFIYKTTNDIHDRVWIVDRSKAKIVGTSLNTLGNKLSYIIDLPRQDLDETINFLKEKNLIN